MRRSSLLLVALVLTGFGADVTKISSADAAHLVTEGKAVLVDVREPAEWADTGVAAPAHLIPKSDFDGQQELWRPFLERVAGRQIILYCRSGHRAGLVAAALAGKGYATANAGGLHDWQAAGLPVRPATAPPAAQK